MSFELKTFLPMCIIGLLPIFSIEANELLLVDYSTEGSLAVSGSFLGPFGASRIVFEEDLTQVFDFVNDPEDATNSVGKFDNYHVPDQLNSDGITTESWGVIHNKTFSETQNVSSYQGLEFSFYSEKDDSERTVSIQLRFNSDSGTSAWNIKIPPPLSNGFEDWVTFTVPLSEAAFNREEGSGTFNLNQLEGIGVLVLNNSASNNTAEEPVYVDDVKLVSSTLPSLLIVSPAAEQNGAVNVKFNDGNELFTGNGAGTYKSRYVSDTVTLSYLAPYGPWSIRIYTTRDDGLEGLIDETVTNASDFSFTELLAIKKIPLKFTTAPTSGVNAFDIGDDVDWSGGDDAKFSFVIKEGGEDPDNDPFYFTLASPANENSPADTNLEFRFGVDVLGAAANVDYSAEVTIELYIE